MDDVIGAAQEGDGLGSQQVMGVGDEADAKT
jgi:hypothetical protein